MKKSILLAAAALTAGLLSAQAQNVYSVNIVGYVNTVLPVNQYVLVANPLDDGSGNQLTNLVASLPNKSTVQIWNGVGYNIANKTFGVWSANYSLPPGVGFFVKNGGAVAITNTFVGNVIASPSTNTIPTTYVSLGSPLPIGGNLTDTNFALGTTLPNKSTIQVYDPTIPGFVIANKTFGAWSSNLNISVGQGFFVKSGTLTNWVQALPSP